MSKEQEGSAWLVELIFQLLRPLVRMIIKAINYHQFTELLKVVYVEEAKALIEREGRGRVTKSEISMITGLDSRQFPTLIIKPNNKTVDLKSTELIKGQNLLDCPETWLLGEWKSDKGFTDKNSVSKILPINGRTNSFEYLVTKYFRRGVTVNSVLRKLEKSGNVKVIDENKVKLKTHLFIPINRNKNETIKIGLNAVVNLLETVGHNIHCEAVNDRFFQRQFWTIRIPQQLVQEVQNKLTRILKKQVTESANYIDTEDENRPVESNLMIGVGYYLFKSGYV